MGRSGYRGRRGREGRVGFEKMMVDTGHARALGIVDDEVEDDI